jgi:hypothetical protein
MVAVRCRLLKRMHNKKASSYSLRAGYYKDLAIVCRQSIRWIRGRNDVIYRMNKDEGVEKRMKRIVYHPTS